MGISNSLLTPATPRFIDRQGALSATPGSATGGLSGTFRNPQFVVFSQKYCRYKWEAYRVTNRRRTAVQIGGVLRRFPFFQAWKPARHSVTNGGRTAVQIGGVLPVHFQTSCTGCGFLNSAQVRHSPDNHKTLLQAWQP